MLRLHQLRSLVALADAGSIRGAARALRLSQAALTQSIGQLERDLDVSLVERRARGTDFTGAGLALLERARSIDADLRRAEDCVRQLSGTFQGSVDVGASLTASLTVIPGAFNRIRSRYPSVRLRIAEGLYPGIIPLVRNGQLDFAVGPQPFDKIEKDLHQEALFEQEIVVAARRDHPLADRTLSFGDLVAQEWIVTGPSGAPGGLIERIFRHHRLGAPRIVIHSESTIALAGILGGSDMLATLPRSVFDAISLNRLRPLAISEPVPSLTIGIIRRLEPWPTPVSAELIAMIRQEAARFRRPK